MFYNRSVNGSLPRSVDTPSTAQFNPGNGSQNNSLQRKQKRQDSSNALNNIGLPNADGKSVIIKFFIVKDKVPECGLVAHPLL